MGEVPLPDDKVIIPGVIDSTTNDVEHPELVAQRIVGFAKLRSLAQDAELASDCAGDRGLRAPPFS